MTQSRLVRFLKKFHLLSLALFAFMALAVAVPQSADAAITKLLTYHGILKDSSNNFLTGTYSIVFRIYNAASGGSALWTETQSSVSASSGRFTVILGSIEALDLAFDADYWLSVQVGADAEMTPRQRLTAAGYAYNADD